MFTYLCLIICQTNCGEEFSKFASSIFCCGGNRQTPNNVNNGNNGNGKNQVDLLIVFCYYLISYKII